MPKRNVLDPQGVAVRNAVRELGLSNVGTVRVGKIIEIEFTGEPDETKLDEICRDLLCNQVIEDYRILGADGVEQPRLQGQETAGTGTLR